MRRTPQLVKGRHTSKGSHLSVSGMTVVFEFFRDLRSSRVASLDLQQTMAYRQMGAYACVLRMLTVVGTKTPKQRLSLPRLRSSG